MAKIKINKLPKGFKLVNGKVVKEQVMNNGGYVTGDQRDYGLVTTTQEYYNNTNFNNFLKRIGKNKFFTDIVMKVADVGFRSY